jgi:hypothetical protein
VTRHRADESPPLSPPEVITNVITTQPCHSRISYRAERLSNLFGCIYQFLSAFASIRLHFRIHQGHSISHNDFFAENVATRVWKHVARTCKCYHQMAVYVQEPLVGRKQTTRVLNNGFIVLVWRIERTLNEEPEELGGCCTSPPPPPRATNVLNSVYCVVCSIIK